MKDTSPVIILLFNLIKPEVSNGERVLVQNCYCKKAGNYFVTNFKAEIKNKTFLQMFYFLNIAVYFQK